jgi:cytidylate kinase
MNITELPTEILELILVNLDNIDLHNISQTCKLFHSLKLSIGFKTIHIDDQSQITKLLEESKLNLNRTDIVFYKNVWWDLSSHKQKQLRELLIGRGAKTVRFIPVIREFPIRLIQNFVPYYHISGKGYV